MGEGLQVLSLTLVGSATGMLLGTLYLGWLDAHPKEKSRVLKGDQSGYLVLFINTMYRSSLAGGALGFIAGAKWAERSAHRGDGR